MSREGRGTRQRATVPRPNYRGRLPSRFAGQVGRCKRAELSLRRRIDRLETRDSLLTTMSAPVLDPLLSAEFERPRLALATATTSSASAGGRSLRSTPLLAAGFGWTGDGGGEAGAPLCWDGSSS